MRKPPNRDIHGAARRRPYNHVSHVTRTPGESCPLKKRAEPQPSASLATGARGAPSAVAGVALPGSPELSAMGVDKTRSVAYVHVSYVTNRERLTSAGWSIGNIG